MPSEVVDNLNFMIVRFEQGWDKWEYRFILPGGGFDMLKYISQEIRYEQSDKFNG